MLDSIRRLMGSLPQESSPAEAFQQLNTVAPLRAEQSILEAGIKKTPSFICREAILDRKQKVVAYEFSLGRELQARMLEKSALIRRVYDESMLRNLAPLGVTKLLGDRLAFIRMSPTSLRNPLLKPLVNSNTVVMINPGNLASIDMSEVRHNIAYLDEIGIKHGWSIDKPYTELVEFLHKADFVEIDTTAFDGLTLKTMSYDLHAANTKQLLIASELQSFDDFNLCFQSAYNFFSGPFVTSRENWKPAKSEINRITVFEALNLIRSGAEFEAITNCMRKDPILTFKLLRYINSPGIGLQNKINEIQQALLVLGRDRFYRWLSLLLFDFKQPGYQENVLKEQALIRARFMEMLAGQGNLPTASDHLFITGLFSLLDVMIGQTLVDVLKQVSLPEVVTAALHGETGAMRNALLLTIAVEKGNDEEMAAAAAECGIDDAKVAELMLDAINWSQQVFAAGESE